MPATPEGARIGHEFVGIVEEVGADVRDLSPGDLVVTPFTYSDGTCVLCRAGWSSNCLHGGGYGNHGMDGGQGEAVRVPFADPTLVKVPGAGHSDETLRSILALSDVACTGHHAAASGGVGPGMTVAVVGDGAVGPVRGARRQAARRRADHRSWAGTPDRHGRSAASSAPTDVVAERGEEGDSERVRELTGGDGTHTVLECVGAAKPALETAFADRARRRSVVSARRRTARTADVPIDSGVFLRNITLTRRRRPCPQIHPGAAPRRPGRAHQPRPRVRLRDRPRAHRRRLHRDGRAAGDQVARARGCRLGTGWHNAHGSSRASVVDSGAS